MRIVEYEVELTESAEAETHPKVFVVAATLNSQLSSLNSPQIGANLGNSEL